MKLGKVIAFPVWGIVVFSWIRELISTFLSAPDVNRTIQIYPTPPAAVLLLPKPP
jgi:hypothetical protein